MKITISLTHLLWIIVAYTAMAATLRAQPVIFNATESASPGDAFYLQGDKFPIPTPPNVPSVYVHVVTSSDTSLTTPPSTGTTLLSSSQILSFDALNGRTIQARLPKNIPLGLYAVWVYDGTYYSAPVFINRARATGFDFGEIYAGFTAPAWTNSAINYTNPGGYTFRVFGRNLNLPGATPTVSLQAGSTVVAANVATTNDPTNPNILSVTVPSTSTIVAGTAYTVNVSNGYGHGSANYDITPSLQTILGRASGTDVFSLGVPWGADYVHIAAKQFNVATDTSPNTGATYASMVYTDSSGNPDWVNAIQQALYDAGNYNDGSGNIGATVYLPGTAHSGIANYQVNHSGEATTFAKPGGTVTQPAGEEFVIPNHVVIMGDGTTSTTITDTTTGMASPNRAFTGTSTTMLLCGLLDLTYTQTATPASEGPPQLILEGQEMCFCNLSLQLGHTLTPTQGGTGPAIGGSVLVGDTTSHDVLVQNIDLNYGEFNAETGALSTESYVMIRGNTFEHHGTAKNCRMLVGGIANMLFEGNLCTRDAAWPGNHDADSAYEQGQLENDAGSYQTIIYNTFSSVGNATLTNFHSDDGETINTQGQPVGGYQPGTISGVTSTSISDSSMSWPSSVLVGQSVSITSGAGAGQAQTITANSGTTVTVGKAWTTNPAVGDHYAVTVNGYDIGTVSSATSTTLTGTSSSGFGTYWPTGSRSLSGAIVAIINGPGTGQWRNISTTTPNTVNQLTVSAPWTEIPTGASTYAITQYECDHALIKGNTLSDQPRGIALYTGSHDCAVVNNTFVDTAESIYVRSDERLGTAQTWPTGGWYGRTNLSWYDVVTDNIGFDTDSTWTLTFSAQPNQNLDSPLVGTLILGAEFRRNIIFSTGANQFDSQIDLDEGFDDWAHGVVKPAYVETHTGALLASIFEDNESVNTNSSNTESPLYLNTSTYQTSIMNELNLGNFTLTPQPYNDATIAGATHASVGTTNVTDPAVLTANFSGTGTSTGGATDMIDSGGAGTLSTGSGVDSASIASASPFDSGSGDYLECSVGVGSGTTGHVTLTPTTTRTSWGRIFDFRSNQGITDVTPVWLVNGAYDFFWRPNQAPTAGNSMRPIDINNGTGSGTNGVRFTFYNSGTTGSGLTMQIITGTNGIELSTGVMASSISLVGTNPSAFAANTIYHVGVTFSTNPATKVTTAKMFCAQGTGAINTATATPIGTVTFTLNPSVVTNTSGILGSGAWTFGDVYGNGSTATTNDYDDLNLYSQDPGTFPALP